MPTLAEAIQKEITRVRRIQAEYRELPSIAPGIDVQVELPIQMMEISIQTAIKALAEGDALACLRVYQDLKEYEF